MNMKWENRSGPMHTPMETEWGFLGTVQVASVHLNLSRREGDDEKLYAGTILLPGFLQEDRNVKGASKEDIKKILAEKVVMWCQAAGLK